MKINFIKACKAGKLEEAKKIFSKVKKNNIKIIEIVFKYAMENNQLDIAKWLYSLKLTNTINLINNICAKFFNNACKYKNLEMIKFLYSIEKLSFITACEFGDLEIVKFLYSLDVKPDIHVNNEEAFKIVCINGYLEIAKWLYSLDDKPDIHIDNEIIFRNTCYSNNLEVAKWLYSLDGKINIHIFDNVIFRDACKKGNLEIAKWLYSLDDNPDIYIFNNMIFRNACYNGNLEIAKWLYSLDDKINIRHNDDEIFINVCMYKYNINRRKVAKWLLTLCDEYYCDDDDNDYLINWGIGTSIKKLYQNKEYDKIIEKLGIQKENFKIDSDNQCLICYDDNYNFISSCKHTFCLECFLMWYIKCDKLDCSYCRQKIVLNESIYQTN
jgi:hypothetical protein